MEEKKASLDQGGIDKQIAAEKTKLDAAKTKTTALIVESRKKEDQVNDLTKQSAQLKTS